MKNGLKLVWKRKKRCCKYTERTRPLCCTYNSMLKVHCLWVLSLSGQCFVLESPRNTLFSIPFSSASRVLASTTNMHVHIVLRLENQAKKMAIAIVENDAESWVNINRLRTFIRKICLCSCSHCANFVFVFECSSWWLVVYGCCLFTGLPSVFPKICDHFVGGSLQVSLLFRTHNWMKIQKQRTEKHKHIHSLKRQDQSITFCWTR